MGRDERRFHRLRSCTTGARSRSLWNGKVKERVLEYLAARAMSGKKDAAILCLVGPPGTGKTSIARSIAKATNKNIFVYLLAASGMNQRSVDIGKLMLERCQDVLLKH